MLRVLYNKSVVFFFFSISCWFFHFRRSSLVQYIRSFSNPDGMNMNGIGFWMKLWPFQGTLLKFWWPLICFKHLCLRPWLEFNKIVKLISQNKVWFFFATKFWLMGCSVTYGIKEFRLIGFLTYSISQVYFGPLDSCV